MANPIHDRTAPPPKSEKLAQAPETPKLIAAMVASPLVGAIVVGFFALLAGARVWLMALGYG
jgi:hypothetical protein